MIHFHEKYGLLSTSSGDMGDSLHRESFARLLNHLMGKDLFGLKLSNEEFVKSCRVAPGLWRRSPDETKWYSNPWTSTRDQYVPLVCWLALTHQMELLEEIRIFLKKRWWFFPNRVNGWGVKEGSRDGLEKEWWRGEFPDIVTPEIRFLLEPWNSRWLPEQSLLLNSRIKCGHFPSYELGKGVKWGDNTNCDDTCHVATLLTFWELHQTERVRTAVDYYINESLRPPGEIVWEQNRVMSRLRYWFRKDWGDNPEYAEAMRPAIQRFF